MKKMASVNLLLLTCALLVQSSPADDILSASGVSNGLCVHLGCGDATVTQNLSNDGHILVHGITSNESSLQQIRERLTAANLAGLVTVEHVESFAALPFNDNFVDLLIVDQIPTGDKAPDQAELLRVVRPEGVLLKRDGSGWAKTVKPVNPKMDDWTHHFYDAAGNPKNNDSLAGNMNGVQWYVSHENDAGSQLFAGGSLLAGDVDREAYDRSHYFVSRNAYNGLLQWQLEEKARHLNQTRGHNMVFGVCADDKNVFGVVHDTGYAQIVDIHTGKTVRIDQGAFIPSIRRDGQFNLPISPIHVRYKNLLIQAYKNEVYGIDPETGNRKWKYTNTEPTDRNAMLVTAGDDKIYLAYGDAEYYQGVHYGDKTAPVKSFVALNLSGSEIWRINPLNGGFVYNMIFHEGHLFFGSLELNKHQNSLNYTELFKVDPATGDIRQRRAINDEGIIEQWDHSAIRIHDNKLLLTTNDLIKAFSLNDFADLSVVYESPHSRGFGHCATYRGCPFGLNAGHLGVISLQGTPVWNESYIARSTCDQAATPAFGMWYPKPSNCGCWPHFHGHIALHSYGMPEEMPETERLETGTLVDTQNPEAPWPADNDWPTIFADPTRSNFNSADMEDLKKLFDITVPVSPIDGPMGVDQKANVDILGPLTPPVVSNGILVAATTDAHCVYAFDATDGSLKWKYHVGGRIDSPPTLYKGLCIFGSRDGYVYALRLSDGRLAWRFFAAPTRRSIVVSGQLESAWPVHGSVLIHNGMLLVAAGRHNDADGGIWLFRLDPFTGQMQQKRRMLPGRDWSHNAENYRQFGNFGRYAGVINDLLTTHTKGDIVFMHNVAIEPQSLHYSHLRSYPEGKPLFPDVPGTGYQITTPGLISYQHNGQENALYRKDSEWFYCVSSSPRHVGANKDPRKIESEMPLVRDGDTLFSRIGGHLAAKILRYQLDENGEPINPETPDTLSDDEDISNFHSTFPENAHMIGTKNLIILSGYTEKGHCYVLKAFSRKDGNLVYCDTLPSQIVKFGMAAANDRVYVMQNNGTISVYGGADVSVKNPVKTDPQKGNSIFATGVRAGLYAQQLGAKSKKLAKLGTVADEAYPTDGSTVQTIPSGALQEIWAGIGTRTIDELVDSRYFPNRPTSRSIIPGMSMNVRHMDNYAVRIRALVKPTQSGPYRFSVSTEGIAELSLSPSENPFEAVVVVGAGEEKSDVIYLEAGKTYYMESLFVENGAMDACRIGWILPDGREESIGNKYLAPYLAHEKN